MRFRAFLAVVLELACGLAPSGLGSPLHRRDILGLGTASCVLGLPLPANPAASSPSQFASPRLCDEAVTRLSDGRADVFLIGTAHISNLSARLVATLIDEVRPDLIMLELDAKRVKQPPGGSPTSAYAAAPSALVAAGASRDSAAPDGQGPLAALGGWAVGSALRGLYSQSEALGLSSGDEFAVAMRAASRLGVPILLADRDVDETLRRLFEALRKTKFTGDLDVDAETERQIRVANDALSTGLKSQGDERRDQVAATVELLKRRATVRQVVAGFARQAPELYEALVASRDRYMASTLLSALRPPGGGATGAPRRVVGVVGMAHEDGIARSLEDAGFRTKAARCA